MNELYFNAFGASDTGRQRDKNEDSFLVNKKTHLICVADGMGGHIHGNTASIIAAEKLNQFIEKYPPELPEKPCFEISSIISQPDVLTMNSIYKVAASIIAVNKIIFDININTGHSPGKGMGTTIAGVLFVPEINQAIIFHVGDSRIYLLRDGILSLKTRDHSLYNQWLLLGSNGAPPPNNIIYRALGTNPEIVPEFSVEPIHKNDIWLACSDGLNNMVDDKNIMDIIKNTNPDNIEKNVKKLINTANKNGGEDNISAILALT